MPYVIIFIIALTVIPTLPLDALPFEIPVPDLVLALAVAVIIRVVVYFRGKNAKKYRKDVEYGSARWGTEKDIKPYIDPNPKNNIILTQTESLTMNSRPKPVKYARNKNVLVIGGSGSGKTRFFVKPNLMQCESDDFPVSFICTDPKGTILQEVGTLLKKRGYRIKVINTIDFKKSMRYNPFVYIRSEKDILKFVTALIQNTKGEGKSGDDFWVKAEQLLYQALIGYIWYEAPPHEQNMNSLVEMINKMEVREDNEQFKNSIDYLFDALEERAPQHFALRQYKKYKLAAGKTAKSILISCGARLAPFDIAEGRDLMSEDELELDNLGGYKKANPDTGEDEIVKQKNALFVIISDTDSSFNFIVALLYSQLFNLLCDRADNDFGGRLPVHCRFLLDEFANIGLIPNFEKLIATIRSREISACVILQAQSQLKAIYKDNMDTIIGNMDTTLFLGGKEKTTLEEISKMLGKETIDMYNTSVTKGNQESHGQNFQKLGKDLLSVDEIAVMDGERCILQVRGERPFLSRKYNIEKHPNYRYLADSNPKHTFNIEDYLSSRLKLRKDDVYVVAEIDMTAEAAV
jgi:type IV secretion system protein VirD4